MPVKRNTLKARPVKTASPAPTLGELGVRLKVVFRPEEDGGYSVSVPALRGCHTEGDTFEEAVANAREAIAGWLETTQDGNPPEPVVAQFVLEIPL